jgi:hypothetical protein
VIGVLEVKLVEEDSTVHIVISLLGPVCVLVAAILAAIWAARTANRRQEKQLAHDRDIRREEHRRDALDQALEKVQEATDLYGTLLEGLGRAEKKRIELDDRLAKNQKNATNQKLVNAALDETNTEVHRDWIRVSRSLDDVRASIGRLRLHFYGHPVTNRAQVLLEKWQELLDYLRAARDFNLSPEAQEKFDELNDEARDANSRLMNACTAWLAGALD